MRKEILVKVLQEFMNNENIKETKKKELQVITLRGGAEVLVDWATQTTCKSCGAKIWWAKTGKGKMMPINHCGLVEYESHFASCKQAKEWRKK